VFRGRTRANLIKIIFWRGTGFWLFTKRLEHGVFFYGGTPPLFWRAPVHTYACVIESIGRSVSRLRPPHYQEAAAQRFGRRAERLDDDQLHLGFEVLEVELARTEARLPPVKAKTVRPEVERPSLPAHLPRADVRFVVESQACPCCGGAMHLIGETVGVMLDHVPARLRVIRIY
jgi:hypothetical protein